MTTKDLVLAEEWCLSGNDQKLVVGDWNGDSFSDLLCHKQTGEMKILIHKGGKDIDRIMITFSRPF